MTVTIDDILALCALAQERGPWMVRTTGAIRNARGECPVCAAVNVVLGTDYTVSARTALQALDPAYSDLTVYDVTTAADWPEYPRRRDLMLALGMEVTA